MPGTPSTQSAGSTARAPLMRRESSQTSHTSKHGVQSPGSGDHPLRHTVKPARHAKVVLPRNHSSARNLQKLQRQAQQAQQQAVEDGRKKSRERSHEGDTEIRLPGSLDTSSAFAPPMRRNLTSGQLPRNQSHTKLKKNLSHGQLTRLGSGRNLAALNATANKGPPSPGLKGRKKRPKSADFGTVEKDLHEQEVELAEQQQRQRQSRQEEEGPGKKVGFAVGSSGDSDGEDAPEMEGSGLQEDEWTDQSNSASPFSTRQNTANNSRRASMILDKPPDKPPSPHAQKGKDGTVEEQQRRMSSPLKQIQNEQDVQNGHDTDEDESDDEPPSPRTTPTVHVRKRGNADEQDPTPVPPQAKAQMKSPLHAAKDHPSPATQRLLSRNTNHPAPALVSNISALDDAHSARSSPAPSMRSSKSNLGESGTEQEDELVSRFIPSASHPSTGSGGNTAMNTPKTNSFHTPESESSLAAQRRGDSKPRTLLHSGPVSPGSTISGSSGATTPAMARSRTELRMLHEKAMADREDAARLAPIVPPHVFDRRNESLKSWLNFDNPHHTERSIGLGPELFQGRFKAANTELKVVQRFRDPIADSVGRMKTWKASKLNQIRGQGQTTQRPGNTQSTHSQPGTTSSSSAQLPISKSATHLSAKQSQTNKLSTSTSPPKSASPVKPAMTASKSSAQLRRGDSRRGKVTFSQTPPETREVEGLSASAGAGGEGQGADWIARELWG